MFYYRDESEIREEFFDRHYKDLYNELREDGYNHEEADTLALEELADMYNDTRHWEL